MVKVFSRKCLVIVDVDGAGRVRRSRGAEEESQLSGSAKREPVGPTMHITRSGHGESLLTVALAKSEAVVVRWFLSS